MKPSRSRSPSAGGSKTWRRGNFPRPASTISITYARNCRTWVARMRIHLLRTTGIAVGGGPSGSITKGVHGRLFTCRVRRRTVESRWPIGMIMPHPGVVPGPERHAPAATRELWGRVYWCSPFPAIPPTSRPSHTKQRPGDSLRSKASRGIPFSVTIPDCAECRSGPRRNLRSGKPRGRHAGGCQLRRPNPPSRPPRP